MLALKGLAPTGVRLKGGDPRLQWRADGQDIESDFERFRPVRISVGKNADSLDVTWQDFGELSLSDDPFFDTSIKRARGLPDLSRRFRTDRETLARVAAREGNLPFAGLVVHMGRTGSTLVHRLFACTGNVHSLSEVTLLVRAIELTRGWPDADRNAAIRDVLAVYRRKRRPSESQFVTKIGSAFLLPAFRKVFPETPWIFCYRDPIEVMVSGLDKPTGLIRNWYKDRAATARRIGLPAAADPTMSAPEFIARLMRRVCRSAVQAAENTPPGQFLAVNYSRLPDAIWETIAPHFGISLTEADKDLMRAEAIYSSKGTNATEFKPDTQEKRAKATPEMRQFADTFARPVFEQLKTLPQA